MVPDKKLFSTTKMENVDVYNSSLSFAENATASIWSNFCRNFIWNEKFWLPKNYTWASINWPPGQLYPDAAWLLDGPLKWSFSLLIIRFLIETLIFEPIGRRLGVVEKYYIPVESNKQLEKYFYSKQKNAKTPKHPQLELLAEQTGWPIVRVKNWFFLKRKHTTPSDLTKFCSAWWRFMCYSIIFIQGLRSVLPKAWIADPMPFAIQWPLNQPIEPEVIFYFFLQFTFYLNLLWSLYFDIPVDAPDFYPMLLHHLVTLGLDYSGFVMHGHRVAAAIHLLHDPADVLLEFARVLHCVKASPTAQRLSNAVFVLFAVTWVITRNIMFPVWVLSRVIFIVPQYTGFCWAMLLTNTMMLIVFGLQIYWSFLIWRVALRSWRSGKNAEETLNNVEDDLFDATEDDSKPMLERRDHTLTAANDSVVFANGSLASNGIKKTD